MLFWQAQMAKQQAQTEMTKDWLTSVEQEEGELKTKVKSLEIYLNNSAPTSIKELQVTESWKPRYSYNLQKKKQPLLQSLSPLLSHQPASTFAFD